MLADISPRSLAALLGVDSLPDHSLPTLQPPTPSPNTDQEYDMNRSESNLVLICRVIIIMAYYYNIFEHSIVILSLHTQLTQTLMWCTFSTVMFLF